jgi:hypothetical protein
VTYGELQNSPEGIPTNILADQLKRLEEAGLIGKSAYQDHPVRYAYGLTEKGKALSEVLLALVRWATSTYRVQGLWRVQRCIPCEAENPLENRIENYSCGRLVSEFHIPDYRLGNSFVFKFGTTVKTVARWTKSSTTSD